MQAREGQEQNTRMSEARISGGEVRARLGARIKRGEAAEAQAGAPYAYKSRLRPGAVRVSSGDGSVEGAGAEQKLGKALKAASAGPAVGFTRASAPSPRPDSLGDPHGQPPIRPTPLPTQHLYRTAVARYSHPPGIPLSRLPEAAALSSIGCRLGPAIDALFVWTSTKLSELSSSSSPTSGRKRLV